MCCICVYFFRVINLSSAMVRHTAYVIVYNVYVSVSCVGSVWQYASCCKYYIFKYQVTWWHPVQRQVSLYIYTIVYIYIHVCIYSYVYRVIYICFCSLPVYILNNMHIHKYSEEKEAMATAIVKMRGEYEGAQQQLADVRSGMHLCMHVYIYIYLLMYVYVWIYIYIYMYIFTDIYIYIYIYVYM